MCYNQELQGGDSVWNSHSSSSRQEKDVVLSSLENLPNRQQHCLSSVDYGIDDL